MLHTRLRSFLPPRPNALPAHRPRRPPARCLGPGPADPGRGGSGLGKTTLVASWVRAEPGPTPWFSADATDADPVRFWGAVVAALDGVAPGLPRGR